VTWTYRQSDGELLHDGEFIGTGYSGHAEGRNNPDLESAPNIGPIPRGDYEIGPAHKSERTGPMTMNLTPIGHNALGRTDFRMHGDNTNHDASHGCIIEGPAIRREVDASPDRKLRVI
jgi:hypothetical protein